MKNPILLISRMISRILSLDTLKKFNTYFTSVVPTALLGVVHILRNQQMGEGVSRCLRLITGGGGGGGLAVDYVIKILIFTLYQFEIFYLFHFPNEFLERVF